MKRSVTLTLATAAALLFGSDHLHAQLAFPAMELPAMELLGQPHPFQSAPTELYPDGALTPGKADTFSVAAIQKLQMPKGRKARQDRQVHLLESAPQRFGRGEKRRLCRL
jgi:hypothetical protein